MHFIRVLLDRHFNEQVITARDRVAGCTLMSQLPFSDFYKRPPKYSSLTKSRFLRNGLEN
jgi:hypothetical protein